MLVNLVPEFLSVLSAADPAAAYHEYLDRHRPVLAAYWHNYVIDPESPHAQSIIGAALHADRSDLKRLLEDVDVVAIAEDALRRANELLEADCPVDLYLMVGVGAANAGELVVGGRGIAFVCLEHFTGRANAQTYGMGLAPELLPLWIAHEVAHALRYTSPSSRAAMRRLVAELGGYYDCWEIGSRATLRELVVNEGAAIAASQAVAPGFEAWEYFGYNRRQYRRLRELDAFLRRASASDLDDAGLGLRLRYLSGGMSPAARLLAGRVLPERSGYYLGLRLVENYLAEYGAASTIRAALEDLRLADDRASGAGGGHSDGVSPRGKNPPPPNPPPAERRRNRPLREALDDLIGHAREIARRAKSMTPAELDYAQQRLEWLADEVWRAATGETAPPE